MAIDHALALPRHVGQAIFPDGATMSAALADRVAAMLRHTLGCRDAASLVLSGGRSPAAFLRALGQRKLDWSRVTVTLADERWVPPGHPDSNAGMVKANLLQGSAAAASFVPLYGGEEDPAAGVASCTERLRDVPRPFDVVVLGMGEDGHFASLFPGIAGLESLLAASAPASAPALAAVVPPLAAHPRMTLTLPALLDARNVLLQINGARKRAVIEEATAHGDPLRHPVAALLQQTATPMRVFFCPSE
jgi:6-phosphogluconolactonase